MHVHRHSLSSPVLGLRLNVEHWLVLRPSLPGVAVTSVPAVVWVVAVAILLDVPALEALVAPLGVVLYGTRRS